MNVITETARKFEFPAEAAEYLGECFQKMIATDGVLDKLYAAMDILFCGEDNSYTDLLQEIADATGIHRYTVDMVFLLLSAKPLEYLYLRQGLPMQMYLDSMADLRYKLFECQKMHGKWGTFVTPWFPGFYRLQRYTFGRLEYDVTTSTEEYKDVLKPGDLMLSCHIPSSGPLLEDAVKDSLRQAYRFFQDKNMLPSNGKLVVRCMSWLLYPPILEKLDDNTNMKKFYRLFDIVDQGPHEQNHDFWRVFYVPYSEEALQTVPVRTRLERVLVEHLKSGEKMGAGKGFLVVDENY